MENINKILRDANKNNPLFTEVNVDSYPLTETSTMTDFEDLNNKHLREAKMKQYMQIYYPVIDVTTIGSENLKMIPAQIIWSSIGTQSPEATKEFALALLELANEAIELNQNLNGYSCDQNN